MPDTPKVKSTGIYTGYFISNPKERYIAFIQPLDSATIADVKDHISSFYGGVIKGVIGAVNTKGTLIYKKDIIIDGVQGMEFEYLSTLNPKVPDVRFQRCVFFNDKVYNLCHWVFTDSVKETEQNRMQFFNSFHINLTKKSTIK